jgi:hypothetical protein
VEGNKDPNNLVHDPGHDLTSASGRTVSGSPSRASTPTGAASTEGEVLLLLRVGEVGVPRVGLRQ